MHRMISTFKNICIKLQKKLHSTQGGFIFLSEEVRESFKYNRVENVFDFVQV